MFILSQPWFAILAALPALYWLLPERGRGPLLTASGAALLAWQSPLSLALLSFFTLVLYRFAALQVSISGRRLCALIALFAVTLAGFKANAALTEGYSIDNASFGDFIIPMGLSYYTLRCIHYAIEKYRGALPLHDFGALAQYLFFLPAMIAGPVHRFPAFYEDLTRRRWNTALFAEGFERIVYGYFKLSFVAGFLVGFQLETIIMELETPAPAVAAYLSMIQMTLLIYFQFAGWSDIAIGFARLLGFRIMENFANPFTAVNISDFWARWHISLTSWCREYVYMGVAAVTRRPALATLAAMMTLALWHEFSLRYLLWGLYNGAGIIAWQIWQKTGVKMPRTASWLLTVHFFMAGTLLVRHDSPAAALEHLMRMWP